jgi:antitoxin VapB
METAKVFKTGRSQAVRIPKKYRFQTSTVAIRRQGENIVLTPLKPITWDEFFQDHTCPDFELDRDGVQTVQDREFFQ